MLRDTNRLTQLTQSSHALRYVLRNKATKTPLFVVVFTLLPKDEHSNEEQAKNDNKDEATTANDDDELD